MSERTQRSVWEFVLCDSLEKVFADQPPRPMNQNIEITAFQAETVSFQLAFRPPAATSFEAVGNVRVTVEECPLITTLSSIDLVPCLLVAFEDHDDGYLRDKPGLYPDLIRPLGLDGVLSPYLGQWRAVWICATVPAGVSGDLPVTVRVHSQRSGDLLHKVTVVVHVVQRDGSSVMDQ